MEERGRERVRENTRGGNRLLVDFELKVQVWIRKKEQKKITRNPENTDRMLSVRCTKLKN